MIRIRAGSQIYQVSTDMSLKTNTEFNRAGELLDETQEEVGPRRSRRVKFGIIKVAKNSGDPSMQANSMHAIKLACLG